MPKIIDREARQAEIVAGALTVFSERGFRDVGMAAVASAIGMSKSSLYHCFAHKEALVEAIVAQLTGAEERAMQRAVASGTDDERLGAMLGALVRSAVEWAAVGPLLFDLLALPSGRAVLGEGVESLRDGPTALLEAAQARGQVRGDLPAPTLAQLLIAAVDGALIQAVPAVPICQSAHQLGPHA